MSSELFFKLEEKIDHAIETVELMRLQLEELEDQNTRLVQENTALKNKQFNWEQNLNLMLQKLEAVNSKQEQKVVKVAEGVAS